ncbi:hypothetical protein Cgig2_027111 [Carnegiea gigantea]|uniref:RING-type domain-containing protein n=1 Tax=Carnegiea gigantea TaxID=171969 RepID=A0A9Q1Q7G7_9CARY|nr:hypothetical protein Cgig2_027111 [Carnegiea gigantea]
MGFPAGYTEILVPKLLINTLFILSLIRTLISALLRVMGLSDFLDPDADWATRPEPDSTATHYQYQPSCASVSATLIREMLPATRFGDVIAESGPSLVPVPESCAVCLYEFEEDDEIRRLRNCSHMFHRSCVDRWIDHDRKTCPLCRTSLIPDELQEAFNQSLWAASGIPEFYSELRLGFICFWVRFRSSRARFD